MTGRPVVSAPTDHVHSWQPCGTAVEERVFSDGRRDYTAVITLAIRSCECGAVRKTEVARRYRRPR